MAEVTLDPRGSEAPNQIDEAKRQKLLELVRGRALARPTDLAEDEVMVWPSLVVVEAVCATVFLMILTLLSIFVSAPLTEHANANATAIVACSTPEGIEAATTLSVDILSLN